MVEDRVHMYMSLANTFELWRNVYWVGLWLAKQSHYAFCQIPNIERLPLFNVRFFQISPQASFKRNAP